MGEETIRSADDKDFKALLTLHNVLQKKFDAKNEISVILNKIAPELREIDKIISKYSTEVTMDVCDICQQRGMAPYEHVEMFRQITQKSTQDVHSDAIKDVFVKIDEHAHTLTSEFSKKTNTPTNGISCKTLEYSTILGEGVDEHHATIAETSNKAWPWNVGLSGNMPVI